MTIDPNFAVLVLFPAGIVFFGLIIVAIRYFFIYLLARGIINVLGRTLRNM